MSRSFGMAAPPLKTAQAHSYPWQPIDCTPNVIHVDMSNDVQLANFIGRYRAEGYQYEIDWGKVQIDYNGIYFSNIDRMPTSHMRTYNNSDGCWILSLDVDSVCIWDSTFLADLTPCWRHNEVPSGDPNRRKK